MTSIDLFRSCLDPRRFEFLRAVCSPDPAPAPGTKESRKFEAACIKILRKLGLAVPRSLPIPTLTKVERFRVTRAAVTETEIRLMERTADMVVDLRTFQPPPKVRAGIAELEAQVLRNEREQVARLRAMARADQDRDENAATGRDDDPDDDADSAWEDPRMAIRREVAAEFALQQHEKLWRDMEARPRASHEFEFMGWPAYRGYLANYFFGAPRAYQRALLRALGKKDFADEKPLPRVSAPPASRSTEMAWPLAVREAVVHVLATLDGWADTAANTADRRAFALLSACWHTLLLPGRAGMAATCSLRDVAAFGWPGLGYLTTDDKGRDDLFGVLLSDLARHLQAASLGNTATTSKGTPAVHITNVRAANVLLHAVPDARVRGPDALAVADAVARHADAARAAFLRETTGAPTTQAAIAKRYAGERLPPPLRATHQARLVKIRTDFLANAAAEIAPIGELQPWFAAWEHAANPAARGDQLVTFAESVKRRLKVCLAAKIAHHEPADQQAQLRFYLLTPLTPLTRDAGDTSSQTES